jgi:hypothetical protein
VKLQVQPSHEDLSAGAFRLGLKELAPSSSTYIDILHSYQQNEIIDI